MDEDRLGKFIKNQVRQHKTLHDPDELWQKIQAKQKTEKKPKRRFLIFWLLGGVFLLGSMGVLFLYTFENNLQADGKTKSINSSIKKPTSDLKNSLEENETSNLTANIDLTPNFASEDKKPNENTALITIDAKNSARSETIIKPKEVPVSNQQIRTGTDLGSMNQTDDDEAHPSNKEKRNSLPTKPLAQTESPVLEGHILNPTRGNTLSERSGINDKKETEVFETKTLTKPQSSIVHIIMPISKLNLTLEKKEIDYSFINPLKSQIEFLQKENKTTVLDKKWRFSNGIAFTYGNAIRSLSNQNSTPSGYVEIRDEMESSVNAVRLNLDFMFQHKNGLYLKSGLEYEQINERYDFYRETVITETVTDHLLAIVHSMDGTINERRGSEEVATTDWLRKKIYNHYRSIDIPFLLGYQSRKSNKALGWFVEGGASMNVWFNANGEILDPNGQALRLEDNANLFKAKTGISLIGAVGLSYRLTNRFSVWGSPDVKYHLGSITSDENPLAQKYLNVGLRLGIRYHW